MAAASLRDANGFVATVIQRGPAPVAAIVEGQEPLTLVGHAAYRSFRNLWMLEELNVTCVPSHAVALGLPVQCH